MQEKLEEVVEQHNRVVERMGELQTEFKAHDVERLKLVGQAQLLEKMIADEKADEAPAPSEDENPA